MKKQLKNRKLGRSLISQGQSGKLKDFSKSEVAGMIRDINRVRPMNFSLSPSSTKGKWTKPKAAAAATAGLAGYGYLSRPHFDSKEDKIKYYADVQAAEDKKIADKTALKSTTKYYDNESDLINATNMDEASKAKISSMLADYDRLKKEQLTKVDEEYLLKNNIIPPKDNGWWVTGLGAESEEDYHARVAKALSLVDADEDGKLDSDELKYGTDADTHKDRVDIPAPVKYGVTTSEVPEGKILVDSEVEPIEVEDQETNWDNLMDFIFQGR